MKHKKPKPGQIKSSYIIYSDTPAYSSNAPSWVEENKDKVKLGFAFFTVNDIYISKDTPQEIKDIYKNPIECDIEFKCNDIN